MQFAHSQCKRMNTNTTQVCDLFIEGNGKADYYKDKKFNCKDKFNIIGGTKIYDNIDECDLEILRKRIYNCMNYININNKTIHCNSCKTEFKLDDISMNMDMLNFYYLWSCKLP